MSRYVSTILLFEQVLKMPKELFLGKQKKFVCGFDNILVKIQYVAPRHLAHVSDTRVLNHNLVLNGSHRLKALILI
jgi:hypothetical protein